METKAEQVVVKDSTEEDTFRALKKPTHVEMRQIWANSELFECQIAHNGTGRNAEVHAFFESYGWTILEYIDGFKTIPGIHG